MVNTGVERLSEDPIQGHLHFQQDLPVKAVATFSANTNGLSRQLTAFLGQDKVCPLSTQHTGPVRWEVPA